MKTTKRALTAAVLLSCACLMAPYYAHAEENVRLHIDGENMNVTQSKAINISEDNGIGIRIDGASNTLTVDSDITTDGVNGNGILVASGTNHTITLNKDKTIQALGENGIAIKFGDTALSNDAAAVSPLVNDFNVSGILKGTQAAIYISPNVFVDRIAIMNGADIQGDIISDWNPPTNSDATELIFGAYFKDDINLEIDSNFNLSYSENIDSKSGIHMRVFGGTLEYNGIANVQHVDIAAGATLSGTGTYILTSQTSSDGTVTRGTFNNMGTFDLGKGIHEISITGSYRQYTSYNQDDPIPNLKVDFNTDNKSDHLIIKEGNTTIQGTITLTPQVDYYYNGQVIKLDPIVQDGNGNALTGVTAEPKINNISPVLEFTVAGDATTTTVNNTEYVCDYSKTQYIINVKRKDQGYQSVATDDISSGIGSAIDIDSQKKYVLTIDKEKLLTSLDYPLTITNTDAERKNVVSNNLKKLNPNVVGSQAQAVIETHTTLNNLVSTVSSLNVGSMSMNTPVSRRIGGLGPTRVEPPKYNSWRNIVIPFSSYTDQHNGSNGYTNHKSGVIGAMERTFANGLTHGYHAAINHQSTEDSGSTIKGEGIYLGTHASYAPAEWNGWSVFGSARLGVEQMRSHRRVYISDSYAPYHGPADGDWTGYSGSFNIGVALTKEHGAVKSGPFAALDYSFAHRPSVHEDGGAVRTNLESATYDSLRTQLGYRLVTNPKPLDSYDSTQWQAHASVAWNHELLSDNGRTSYQLADFPGTTIEDNIETYGRDSMSIAAGVIFKTPNRLDVGLTLGSDIYRKGGSSIYGKATFEWKF